MATMVAQFAAPGNAPLGDRARPAGRVGAMPRRPLVVRVPASSANLGPGFDSLACALDLHLELELVETGRFAVETDLAVATDRRNLVVRGFEALHPADRFTFRIRSEIPLSGGLGSSAAACVAGVMAAAHVLGHEVDVLALAAELEGHADNAAAAVHGGFVVCAPGGAVARLDPPDGLAAILVVPHDAVRTRDARAALPESVPLADAAFNAAHAALLALGLARGDLELVAASLDDRLHQPHRAHLYPRSADLVASARALGALGATISGAGPSVLVWARAPDADGLAAALRDRARGWAEVRPTAFCAEGARLRAG
jgi:homoserine kinase